MRKRVTVKKERRNSMNGKNTSEGREKNSIGTGIE
jgi:hypothetical protein